MFDFLGQPFVEVQRGEPLTWLVSLVVAAILGACVAWVYRASRGSAGSSPAFSTTLVLLAVLIAMVTQIIGNNVARAFSLVGALSIVRFRTVVRDTRDTAFVIFSVVIGMAAGAHAFLMAAIGFVIVSAAAFAMRRLAVTPRPAPARYLLNLRLGLVPDIEAVVGATLDAHLCERHQVSVVTTRQGLSVDIVYEGRLNPGASPDSAVLALNRLDGVQRVEMTRRQSLDDDGAVS